ncbi:histone H1E [Drosophila pseudoobscura]|uniref:Histone H1E n=3 Tax=Drosophila pseudoobscura TaxID=7237 RepID=B5DKZ4_DROPS|nr:histone H1E [Drosophila pseudoobscura]
MNSTAEESENEIPERNESQSEGSVFGSESDEGPADVQKKTVQTDDEEDVEQTDDEEDAEQTDDEEGAVEVTKAPAVNGPSKEEENSMSDSEEDTAFPPIYPTPPPEDGRARKRKDTVLSMALDALQALNSRSGSSVRAIVKYLKSNGHKVENERRLILLVHKVLKQSVISGQVVQNKLSFKLSETTKNERKAMQKMKANKAKAEQKAQERAKKAEEKAKAKEEAKATSKKVKPKPKKAVAAEENKAKAKPKPKAKPGKEKPAMEKPAKEKPAKPSERKTNQPRKKLKTDEGAVAAVASTSSKAAAGAAVLAAMEVEMAGPSEKPLKKVMTKLVFDDDDDAAEAPATSKGKGKGKGSVKINIKLKKPIQKRAKGEAVSVKAVKQMEGKSLPDVDKDLLDNMLVAQATSTPQALVKKTARKRK